MTESRFSAVPVTLDTGTPRDEGSLSPAHSSDGPMVVEAVGVSGPPRVSHIVREPRGNPLWPIPLKALSATRERPIFLPSRRPPAALVVPQPATEPIRIPPPLAKPDSPRLTLLGSVTGHSEGFAIFIDQSDQAIIRLRTGEDHLGWVLRSVRGREAVLQKDRETIVFSFPALNEGTSGPVTSAAGSPSAMSSIVGAPNHLGTTTPSARTVPGRPPPR